MDLLVDRRRTLRLLAASYALAWAAISITSGPGPSSLVAITGRDAQAGLYFAVFSFSAAAGSAVGGRLMDRLGRRPVLAGAHALAAVGYLSVGLGVASASFWTFIAGLVMLSAGTGAGYLTRLATAEMFPPAERGRGIAWALMGAAVGALLGPLLLMTAGAATPLDEKTVWLVAAPLPLLAGLLVARAHEPLRLAHAAAPLPSTHVERAPRRLPIWAAITTLALAQSAMVAIMGVAGASLGAQGHTVRAMGWVMALHFVGMFALSPVVGRVSDVFGRRATILSGLVVLATGALVVAAFPGILFFAAGLFLVGLGWSFGYVGATLLLTESTPAARRARWLGRADLTSSLGAGATVALAGIWYARHGLEGLGLAGAILLIVPFALVLALRPPKPDASPTETPG